MVADGLERGQPRHADWSGLLEAEVLGLGREPVLLRHHVLGERTLADSEDLVTGLESGHAVAHRLDDAGQLAPEDGILGSAKPETGDAHQVGLAGHQVPDAPIHAGGANANEHPAVFDGGFLDVFEMHEIGRAVEAPDGRLHGALPNESCWSGLRCDHGFPLPFRYYELTL